MKSIRLFNGWDLLAVALTLVAAALVIQYSLARGGKPAFYKQPLDVSVRLPRPIPAVMERVSAGDAVLDSRGQRVGRILSLTWVEPVGNYTKGRWSGDKDMLLDVLLEGEIPLVRDEPGFARSPGNLKAGVWCLVTTDRVELSGLVVRVEPLPAKGPGNMSAHDKP
jgi:hypothetical protein